jgi:DNA repair protein RecO (recombination protein O)
MRWAGQAIILSVHKMGENAALARVFSREEGVCSGAVRHAFGKVNRGIYQPGNIIQAVWQARVATQLGALHSELEVPVAALVMPHHGALLAMSSALMLVELSLPTYDPHPQLYDALAAFLQRLRHGEAWQTAYIKLELVLLAECGFGLDLERCVATGQTTDLGYVSPKSGGAVSREAGRAYHDKLLRLPAFLQDESAVANAEDLAAGLRLTGYFLEHRLLAAQDITLPAIRQRLAIRMTQPVPEDA